MLVIFATLVISFILSFAAYELWSHWRYPQTDSMDGLGGFNLSLDVALICAVIAGVCVARWNVWSVWDDDDSD
jgi:phosphatidylserine synthase